MTKERALRLIVGSTLFVVGLGCLTFAISLSVLLAFEKSYQQKMYPGVQILGVDVSGQTIGQARTNVQQAIDRELMKGLLFQFRDRQISLPTSYPINNPDTASDMIRYDLEGALSQAIGYGKTGSFWMRSLQLVRLQSRPALFLPQVHIDEDLVVRALTEQIQSTLPVKKDASFVTHADVVPPTISIQADQAGVELSTGSAIQRLHEEALRLSFQPILIKDAIVPPAIVASDLEPLIGSAEAMIRRPSITLMYEKKAYVLGPAEIGSWIVPTGTRDSLQVALSRPAFEQSVHTVLKDLEKEPTDGVLKLLDATTTSFTAGKTGLAVRMEDVWTDVMGSWPATSTFALPMTVTYGKIGGDDVERLGIRELIGVGTSDFSGSPSNRRKNIAHGIKQVNGTLIAPGGVFSLITVLGPIDAEHAWLPELVIKKDKTEPDFGGGLCQIGTTTFRAALASGLPIVERQNHSYRVRYYEPAGTDATIFVPKPDFRFLNDTENSVYIHAFSKGDQVVFEFWGTKDGRVASSTTPKISNIVPPPPQKNIETLDLKPGEKKCTETAHAGADAEFTYSVQYPNGKLQSRVFQSHYRPWQAVCLVGVKTLTASSTGSGIEGVSSTPDTLAIPLTP